MVFDVLGLGVSTMDLLFLVDELPGTELVQKARASAIEGGGPVATAMVALARLGAQTAMLDRIGNDLFGSMILEQLHSEGVATDGIVVEDGRTSSKASILVRQRDGARAITFAPGDAADLSPDDVREEMIRCAKILHVNGRHWDACVHAARVAKEAGVRVSFDGGAHRFKPEHRELLPLVDICIVAGEYAAALTGKKDTGPAADAILDAGPEIVVITQGTEGSSICSKQGERFHQGAYRIGSVVDTTGAGDAYHGAFLYGIARGFSLPDTARYASAVGALNTRSLGGRSALPTLTEVEEFLSRYAS